MARVNSRAKGAAFERLTVNAIREAFAVGGEDCFRTPGSGGHMNFSKRYPGDVYVSEELRKRFPFVVECKHHKTWHAGAMMLNRKSERAWLEQVTRDTKKAGRGIYPLLVMRGPSTPIYAALPGRVLKRLLPKGTPRVRTYLVFQYRNQSWVMMDFPVLLTILTEVKV